MMLVVVYLLLGVALLVSLWTIVTAVRSQLPRYRALFAPPPALTGLPMRPTRVTVRWAPARVPARAPMRAAA